MAEKPPMSLVEKIVVVFEIFILNLLLNTGGVDTSYAPYYDLLYQIKVLYLNLLCNLVIALNGTLCVWQ